MAMTDTTGISKKGIGFENYLTEENAGQDKNWHRYIGIHYISTNKYILKLKEYPFCWIRTWKNGKYACLNFRHFDLLIPFYEASTRIDICLNWCKQVIGHSLLCFAVCTCCYIVVQNKVAYCTFKWSLEMPSGVFLCSMLVKKGPQLLLILIAFTKFRSKK